MTVLLVYVTVLLGYLDICYKKHTYIIRRSYSHQSTNETLAGDHFELYGEHMINWLISSDTIH